MFPTTVYAELTPNPNTMKFVSDRVIFKSNDPVEFKSVKDASGHSELAVQLFNFPFVEGVFIDANYVTVTKSGNLNWDLITFELREFIREFLVKTEFVVEKIPEFTAESKKKDEKRKERNVEPSDYDDAIKAILLEYVKPAVEKDGGAIDFVSFKDGTVTVELRGSCSGCPSSTVTLKNGIERLLTAELPEVKEVVAESV